MSPQGLGEFEEHQGQHWQVKLGRNVAVIDYVQSVNWENCSKIVKYPIKRMKEVIGHVSYT